jgi:AAA+ superfamily predicted ATPase/uncharacterized low-complexity protein
VKRVFKWFMRLVATLVVVSVGLIAHWISYGFDRGKIGGVTAVGALIAGTWVVSQIVAVDTEVTFAAAALLTVASIGVDQTVSPFDKLKATGNVESESHVSPSGEISMGETKAATDMTDDSATTPSSGDVVSTPSADDSGKSGEGIEDNNMHERNEESNDREESGQKQGIDASEVDIGRDGGDSDNGSSSDDILTSEFFTEPPEMDFNDVAGMDAVKEELRTRVIEPLENPEKYEEYGLSVESGFLFHGPPGTGKTYISKALAGELGIEYAQVKGTDLISRFVGAGAENVGELFEEAREHQPCMVFIDEIDAVASERKGSGQHQMQSQMVNQLLEEIGELNDSDEDIIVVGATNRLEQLDDAIIRSGRLSEHIEIGLPDPESRINILDTHLDAPRSDELNLDIFRRDTEGLNAADMEQVAVNAAREAMLREDVVTTDDIKVGVDKVQSVSQN